MAFKGVLLDLDNTLYDYEAAHKPALKASVEWLSEKLQLPCDTVHGAYREARSQINRELSGQGASHSRLLYFQRINEILGYNPSFTVLGAEKSYWNVFLDNMEFRPGALDFLDSIQDIPIAIVTDLTAQIQFQKLIHLRIEHRFSAIVTSEESGAEKPDPRIFNLALRKLNVEARDACVIGDNWKKDILGGINLGMRSFWLKQDEYNEPNELAVEFGTFAELTHLIRQFG